jgi:hypothetical protein
MVRSQREWFEFCIYTSVELATTPGTPLLSACLSNPLGRWKNQEVTDHRVLHDPSLPRRVPNDHRFSRTYHHL